MAASASASAAVSSCSITLPRMDDWHLHLRDGAAMASLLQTMPNTMARAIVMPNLKPPVTTVAAASSYRDRILAALPAGSDFEPLLTLYLTDNTTAEEIEKAKASGFVHAVKLYPAGATTNSDHGVTDMKKLPGTPALTKMAELGMPLLIHGEVTDKSIDIFDRETAFIETVLPGIVAAHPTLKIVLEHITTERAAQYVLHESGDNVAATITAHHLLLNRNALFEGGIRPHRYCLPVLKAERDRQALLSAVRSGSPKFFLGTDSAPHTKESKECCCGAAGMFTAHAAAELYALAFEEAGCIGGQQQLQQEGKAEAAGAAGAAVVQQDGLSIFRAFCCENGPRFYGLPSNAERLPKSCVVLRKGEEHSWQVPESLAFGGSVVIPFMAGEKLSWKAEVVSLE